MKTEPVMDKLLEKDIIDSDTYLKIKAEPTDREKNITIILKVMMRRTDKDIDEFARILHENNMELLAALLCNEYEENSVHSTPRHSQYLKLETISDEVD